MFEEYIGLTEVELSIKLTNQGKDYRVVSKNGSNCIITRDVQVDRLNVTINNSIVTSVNGWG